MKILSLAIQLCFVLFLGYLWLVSRVLVGTQEIELAVWKSPYLKELFIWLIIGVPLVLFFQSSSSEEENEEKEKESNPPSPQAIDQSEKKE